MLTVDNLFDGTIITSSEQYYIEPSNKYSNQLHKNGVHTIIYKLSDVKMHHTNHNENNDIEHCASENLRKKILNENSKNNDYFSNRKDRFNKEIVNEKSDNYRTNSTNSNDDVNSDTSDMNKKLKREKRWLPDEVSYTHLKINLSIEKKSTHFLETILLLLIQKFIFSFIYFPQKNFPFYIHN